jgi:glucose/arabinose dehydrogenase
MKQSLIMRAAILVILITLIIGAALGPQIASAKGGPTIGLQQIAGGLTAPMTIAESPDGTGRLFIVDQVGLIYILNPDGSMSSQPFLDLRSKIVALSPEYDERGLLGFAFHPDYAHNGRFFVFYNAPLREGAPAGWNSTIHISEFHVSSDQNQADAGSEKVLLQIDKPQMNHNGGTLAFGPEGYLYISVGDGGGANDTDMGHVDDWYTVNAGGNGQDITQNLLGNVLRINVNKGDPYAIPSTNPFVGKAGLDEIYAYGLRNPFRFSFDMGGSHQLYLGDAGQDLWEEIDLVVKGGNYGWNVKEGLYCFNAANSEESLPSCPSQTPDGALLRNPVLEYTHIDSSIPGGIGHVVIGGYVYRGASLPQFKGRYIFGDWSRDEEAPDGVLMVAKPQQGMWSFDVLQIKSSDNGQLNHFLLGFGQDRKGEVYVLTSDNTGPSGSTGKVFKIVSPTEK